MMQAAEGEEKILGRVDGDGRFFMWRSLAAGGGGCSSKWNPFPAENTNGDFQTLARQKLFGCEDFRNAVCCFSESAAAAELRIVC